MGVVSARMQKAMLIAKAYHVGQEYSDERPYMEHISDVYTTARAVGIVDEDTLIACFLHDIIEDTTYTLDQLEVDFGFVVKLMVELLTDLPGPNRKTRKADTLARFKKHRTADYGKNAILVKLCDRFANTLSGKLREMYRKEHPAFKEALYVDDPLHKHLWEMIEKNLGLID